MATDVNVQYFSHLNGLVLGNNWGDLIRLLDKALVTGIDFTQITAASINAQGDVHITLYAAHNSMLFQVVELTGFTPTSLNQKYRIKGVPNTTQLILKPHTAIAETSITTVGAGKLASLGYDIIFRDTGDVKRVYRAKNPTAQHPFIRVDESLASDTGSYTATYAKYAMVGLLEHMGHIDDFENPNVLQLPFDPSDPAKNWKITGTGTDVVRGWSKWHWAHQGNIDSGSYADSNIPLSGNRSFTLVGDVDAFYLVRSRTTTNDYKYICGCGLFDTSIESSLVPNWFLMTSIHTTAAGTAPSWNSVGNMPLAYGANSCSFFAPKFDEINVLAEHTQANPIMPNYGSGYAGSYNATRPAALGIPFSDIQSFLRGSLKHVYYNGNNHNGIANTTPLSAGNNMYIQDTLSNMSGGSSIGGYYFYLGEFE